VTVLHAYEAELVKRGFQSDPAQLRAVQALDRCANEWADYKAQRSNALKKLIHRPDIPRGVYMYGGVGRGKSFLMDLFFNAVPLRRKTRLHFHEFMREVHRELADLQGTVNPLDELGLRISKRYKLICFDEFHVADITDAMILHRLLAALFDNGVGFVTTSNLKPDDLYPNGLHRDRILPAIALLNEKLEVLSVDNGTDYRNRTLEQLRMYLTPNGATGWPRRPMRTRCFESSNARSMRGAWPVAWCGSISGRCAAAPARKTTTSKSRASSTPCCFPMCPRCRSRALPKRAASPGWSTCFTIVA
jgi:cell division protein ZapE